jgi:hypothetical protein
MESFRFRTILNEALAILTVSFHVHHDDAKPPLECCGLVDAVAHPVDDGWGRADTLGNCVVAKAFVFQFCEDFLHVHSEQR